MHLSGDESRNLNVSSFVVVGVNVVADLCMDNVVVDCDCCVVTHDFDLLVVNLLIPLNCVVVHKVVGVVGDEFD